MKIAPFYKNPVFTNLTSSIHMQVTSLLSVRSKYKVDHFMHLFNIFTSVNVLQQKLQRKKKYQKYPSAENTLLQYTFRTDIAQLKSPFKMKMFAWLWADLWNSD